MPFRLHCRLLALPMFSLACHDATSPAPRTASIHFSGAANVADTIFAPVAVPLVVDVRDSTGAPAPPGLLVQFTTINQDRGLEMFVAPLSSTRYTGSATSTTDETGRASVQVALGGIAGPARVVVSVPALAVQDTARFTVTPGNLARVVAAPFDTAVMVGRSYKARGGSADRNGNPRPDPATWSSSDPGLTVTSDGQVTGVVAGRYTLSVSNATGSASSSVNVMPVGRFVTLAANISQTQITTMDADGTNETVLTTVNQGTQGAFPAWIPGTNTVIYMSFTDSHRLYTVTPGASPQPFLSSVPATMTQQAEPRPSADGKWVYFSALDSRCVGGGYCVARARSDGTGVELVITGPSRAPSPSPDGSKVAYASDLGFRVFDVATKTSSPWAGNGFWPTWSPDGAQIVSLAPDGTALSFVAPDGTGARTVKPAVPLGAVLAWSPDGKWVIGHPSGSSALINASSGVTLPLTFPVGRFVTSMK
jgi:hypothetical protein